jgi:hypothetical protein
MRGQLENLLWPSQQTTGSTGTGLSRLSGISLLAVLFAVALLHLLQPAGGGCVWSFVWAGTAPTQLMLSARASRHRPSPPSPSPDPVEAQREELPFEDWSVEDHMEWASQHRFNK